MDSGRKLAIGSPHLIPKLALIDPELTLGLPPHLTAGTGMDAFTHNIECFLSNAFNPPADAIALDGLEKAWRYVERATRDGSDREARYNMAMAAMEGAMVFQKGLGAVHALSHPTGGLKGYRLHHGTLNAVYLPAVLRFNEPAVGEKYKRVARIMGLPEREANAAGRGQCRDRAQRAARHPERARRHGPAAGHRREDRRRRAGRPLPSVDAAPADQGRVHGTDRGELGLDIPRLDRARIGGGSKGIGPTPRLVHLKPLLSTCASRTPLRMGPGECLGGDR